MVKPENRAKIVAYTTDSNSPYHESGRATLSTGATVFIGRDLPKRRAGVLGLLGIRQGTYLTYLPDSEVPTKVTASSGERALRKAFRRTQ